MTSNEYMTVKEVMEFLKIARPTVYKYVSNGKLKVYHSGVGRRALFSRAEVEKMAEVRPAGEPQEEAEATRGEE